MTQETEFPMVIHGSLKRKVVFVILLVIAISIGLFLLTVTPHRRGLINLILFRAMGLLVLGLLLASIPRIFDILFRPLTRLDVEGVQVGKRVIPWDEIIGIRCVHDAENQSIYLRVRDPHSYQTMNVWNKRFGYQQEDEVYLNFSPASPEDFRRVCAFLRQQIRKNIHG